MAVKSGVKKPILTNVSDLQLGDVVVIHGHLCEVDKVLSPNKVRAKEYKRKGVPSREFKDKWRFLEGDRKVQKVSTT